ncbi:MAG: 50S ribosomal protein L10 [Endomicrobiia bacterium]|nr:MAG: 50S ribosomal protein L10 [Endomicrobiia bacterium]
MPNLKNRQEVENLAEKFKTMKGLILTEYHGLKVEEIAELRSKLRPLASEYAIVKNTLSKIAFKEVGIETGENFSGPTALVIENGDIISPAKVVVEFSKMHAKLKVKAGFLEKKFVDASFIVKLSLLPSREVLITKMLNSLNAPITSLVNILLANIREFVKVLDAIIKKQTA